jgi:hypothetical protein
MPPLNPAPPNVPKSTPQHRAVVIALSLMWTANIALLIGVFTWIWTDGGFMRPISTQAKPPAAGQPAQSKVLLMSPGRLNALVAVGLAAVATLAGMIDGLFFGAPRHRRIRSWLAFTTVVALWLTILTAWPQIAWAGLRWRVGRAVEAFEPIAAQLRDDWPTTDGSDPLVGVYSAYPPDKPRMLLLLGPKAASDSGMRFTSIEKSPAGALRFELTGNEQDAWLEWHPEGSRPASFVGALMIQGEYELKQSAELAPGWYATRYETPGIVTTR